MCVRTYVIVPKHNMMKHSWLPSSLPSFPLSSSISIQIYFFVPSAISLFLHFRFSSRYIIPYDLLYFNSYSLNIILFRWLSVTLNSYIVRGQRIIYSFSSTIITIKLIHIISSTIVTNPFTFITVIII